MMAVFWVVVPCSLLISLQVVFSFQTFRQNVARFYNAVVSLLLYCNVQREMKKNIKWTKEESKRMLGEHKEGGVREGGEWNKRR